MIEESQKKIVGSNHTEFDTEYAQWIAELAKRYRSSQIKASIKVNDDMIRFYWSVGEDIEKRKYENRYGTRFYENVSKDLKHALGLSEGLSPTTIKYTHYFYQLYSPLFVNRQQSVDESVPANRQEDHNILGNKISNEMQKSLIRNNFPPQIAERMCDAIDGQEKAEHFQRLLQEYNEWLINQQRQQAIVERFLRKVR